MPDGSRGRLVSKASPIPTIAPYKFQPGIRWVFFVYTATCTIPSFRRVTVAYRRVDNEGAVWKGENQRISALARNRPNSLANVRFARPCPPPGMNPTVLVAFSKPSLKVSPRAHLGSFQPDRHHAAVPHAIDEFGTADHSGRSLDRARCAGYLVPSFAASSQDGHVRDSSGTS
jgi:hypothetical protein